MIIDANYPISSLSVLGFTYMQYLDEKRLERLRRLPSLRYASKKREKDKRYERRTGRKPPSTILDSYNVSHEVVGVGKNGMDQHVVNFPPNLSLESNRDNVINTVEALNTLMEETRDCIKINIRDVENFDAPALIYLASQIDKHMTLRLSRINGNYPKRDYVHSVMQDLGFFKVIGAMELLPEIENTDRRIKILGFKRGQRANNQQINDLQDLLIENIPSAQGGDDIATAFFEIMQEAMQNVIDHAYKHSDGSERKFNIKTLKERWWVSTFVDTELEILFFMMCDLGAGMPETIKERMKEQLTLTEKFKEWLGIGAAGDSDYIDYAMTKGVSSTDQVHRGLGLRKMRRTTDRFPGSRLSIYSKHGEVHYDGDRLPISKVDHTTCIEGTIVLWTVNYAQKEEENGDDYSS